jgi:nucleotidyltransferase/DNA polymerase involved in DNA repair
VSILGRHQSDLPTRFTGKLKNRFDDLAVNFSAEGLPLLQGAAASTSAPSAPTVSAKSVGAETTFSQDLADYEALATELQPLIEKVWHHCETTAARGRTATLKVKFSDFELITRSRSVAAIDSASDLFSLALELPIGWVPTKKRRPRQPLTRAGYRSGTKRMRFGEQLPLPRIGPRLGLDSSCTRASVSQP